jgi:tetratricopeptide (TPR) repeat protein
VKDFGLDDTALTSMLYHSVLAWWSLFMFKRQLFKKLESGFKRALVSLAEPIAKSHLYVVKSTRFRAVLMCLVAWCQLLPDGSAQIAVQPTAPNVVKPSVRVATLAGKIFSVQGSATVKRGTDVIQVTEGLQLEQGDELITGQPGRVAVELPDGSYIRVASGSTLRMIAEDKKLGLFEGALHFLSHAEKHPIVQTQQVTASIRGTEFTVTASKAQTTISMLSGSVDAAGAGGRAQLSAGQGAHFRSGRAPEIFSVLASDKSVQWSMFIPFALDGSETDRGLRAVELYKSGRVNQALAELSREAIRAPCSADAILRARMLLASGDPVSGTSSIVGCADSTTPDGPRAAALTALSTVKLMQGDTLAADKMSEEALKAQPDSANARLARSFVLQERGDLDGALALFDNAADAQTIARKAELLFMSGRVPEARALLDGLPNRSWYADSIYGFVLMADRSFEAAEAAFLRASLEEPGAGLPRVGLGIIRVNRNDLSGARKEFERATLLEPSRSLYRSYLGKSYFEDDMYSGASPEYERAMQLDPNDPTPYLYRSFMRVAENDLVGALEDISRARELSGARSVYRSKFLLDQDSAMQSASVGRVYQQLGFKERGRLEAITAITDDYTNPTAHRLLSQTQEDIFAADTIASEQRISNLFAPLSVNVVDSIGTGVSLNEYSQLFERDGWRTAVNSFYGSPSDVARGGVLSAYKNENIVLGLSADGSIGDGISDNPRSSAGTVGFSLQGQPSWADRFLLEGRGVFTGSSDVDESVDALNGHASAAYLHKFSPSVTGIVQTSYDREREAKYRPFFEQSAFYTEVVGGVQESDLVDILLDQRTRRYETNLITEAQLIAKTGKVNSIITLRNNTTGLDSYERSEILEDSVGVLDGAGASLRSTGPVNLSGNAASYLGDYSVTDGLHLQFGAEFESIEWASQDEPPFSSNSTSKSLWSPKAGVVFTPSRELTARVGYGESLGKGTRTDLISIEPTMIGGITQRYNDLAGTKSQNLGFGLDLHPRESTFLGAEWTRRWLDENRSAALSEYVFDYDRGVGYGTVDLGENYDVPIGQDMVSVYGYEVLTRNLVGGVDYRFVRQDIELPGDGSLTDDHRANVFSRYFLSNGVFLQGSASYRYQDRRNVALSGEGPSSGSDGAWLIGAGIGYRLPTRHGLILLDVQNIFGQDISLDQTTYFNEPVFSDPTVRLSANFNF